MWSGFTRTGKEERESEKRGDTTRGYFDGKGLEMT